MSDLLQPLPTAPSVVCMADPPPARGVGRPRDPRLDAAVLAATRALLVEVGYHQLSIEAVARRAHVHRPVIYRRWRSKAELVHDAVYSPDDTTLRITDSGDFLTDLRACVRNSIALHRRPEVLSAFTGLMAAQRTDPELRAALLPRLEASARADFAAFVRRAVRRGQARPVVEVETLFEVLAGTVIFHLGAAEGAPNQQLEAEVFTVMTRLTGASEPVARGPRTTRKTAPRRAGATKKTARRG